MRRERKDKGLIKKKINSKTRLGRYKNIIKTKNEDFFKDKAINNVKIILTLSGTVNEGLGEL